MKKPDPRAEWTVVDNCAWGKTLPVRGPNSADSWTISSYFADPGTGSDRHISRRTRRMTREERHERQGFARERERLYAWTRPVPWARPGQWTVVALRRGGAGAG